MTVDLALLLKAAPLANAQLQKYLKSNLARSLDRLVRKDLEHDQRLRPNVRAALMVQWSYLHSDPRSAAILYALLRDGDVASIDAFAVRAREVLDDLDLPLSTDDAVTRLAGAVGNAFVAAQKSPEDATQRATRAVLSAITPLASRTDLEQLGEQLRAQGDPVAVAHEVLIALQDEFRALREHETEVAAQLERRLADQLQLTSPPLRTPFPGTLPKLSALQRSPRPLLLSEHRVIPMIGRDAELDALKAWCAESDPLLAFGITGNGGSGKTRLATELAFELAGADEEPWFAGVIDRNVVLDEAGIEALARLPGDVLIIVDYAELRAREVPRILERAYRRDPAAGRFRVLVIARTVAEPAHFWAPFSRGGIAGVIIDQAEPPLLLDGAGLSASARDELWTQAAQSFAITLRTAAPRRPSVPLIGESFGNPLAIAALALAQTVQDSETSDLDDAWTLLTSREQAYWDAATERTGVHVSRRRAARATALAALVRPATRHDCKRALAELPELRTTPPDQIDDLASWLQASYPHDAAFSVGLQPDILAERLIQDELLSDEEFNLVGLLDSVDPMHLARTAEALARTYQSQPASRAAIRTAVDSTLEHLVTAAEQADEVDAAIALLIGRAASPQRAALIAHRHHPENRSTASIIACSRHAVAWASAFGWPGIDASRRHALRLRRNGLRHEALQCLDEALASLNRSAEHMEVLVVSDLTSLRGTVLAEIGRIDEAIAAEREAIGLLSLIPDRTFDDELRLSMCTMNLGLWLSDTGAYDEALSAIFGSANEQFPLLASAHPDGAAATRELLLSLGADSSDVPATKAETRDDEFESVLEVLRHPLLHDPGPDVFMHLLSNLSAILGLKGEHDRALRAAREAVRLGEIWFQAAAISERQLASAVLEFGHELAAVGDLDEARTQLERATEMFRALADADGAYRETLAASLDRLSLVVGRNPDELDNAIALSREAVEIITDLFAHQLCHGERYAVLLTNLGILLAEAGEAEEAIRLEETALAEFRDLALLNARFDAAVRQGEANLVTYRRLLASAPDAR
jgi:tetratricopeptide (TPR) repeat protein